MAELTRSHQTYLIFSLSVCAAAFTSLFGRKYFMEMKSGWLVIPLLQHMSSE